MIEASNRRNRGKRGVSLFFSSSARLKSDCIYFFIYSIINRRKTKNQEILRITLEDGLTHHKLNSN